MRHELSINDWLALGLNDDWRRRSFNNQLFKGFECDENNVYGQYNDITGQQLRSFLGTLPTPEQAHLTVIKLRLFNQ